MKANARLCALFLTLVLLFSACTGPLTPPADTQDGQTPPETSATPDRPTDSSTGTLPTLDADTTPETSGATDTAPAPDPSVDAPEGYLRFFDPTALTKVQKQRLRLKKLNDEAGFAYIRCNSTGADPWFVLLNSAANQQDEPLVGARYMRIKYRTSGAAPGRVYIGKDNITESGAIHFSYTADGTWHTLTVDLSASGAYDSTIACVRYDPTDGATADESIDVAWIAFYPPEDDPTADLPPLPEDAPNLSDYTATPDGSAHYIASGHTAGGDGTYIFKEDFVLDIYRRGYFNRYTVGYSSTAPIKGEVTYLYWNDRGEKIARTEEFFLEAGDNQTFASLIDGYLAHTYAWGISRITMKTCDGSTATFSLHSLSGTVEPIYNGTYYLENDRYKLGVLLSWGGGISYIEDKQDGDDSIKNLINRADPGRLVQQSYYGIQNGPHYTAGTYNGTEWRYNPVQGGDVFGNGSKLVDIRVLEDGKSLYIKCRPMDWAKNNEPTPSYMENTYTLAEDGIRVHNRFVDFFGVEHPAHHFELPAFYTISYLGTFHYYNGSKPWTGAPYETLPNEPFWAGNKKAYHSITKGNTETWAAWTAKDGWGIGLYVPGVEILLAGRHEHNGSKDPANGGTSYVAPLRTMAIVSFVPFEYEYIISTGTVADMRTTFKTFAEANGYA